MKKFLAFAGLIALSTGLSAQAITLAPLTDAQITTIALATVEPMDLINWKVGDTANYTVNVGSFLKGSSIKSVTKDEGTAIWVTQNMDLMIQKQKIEILISKADGKVLKTIVNGKEQTTPEDPIEIISQDYVDITVPAGTFNAIHIVAKSKQIEHLEIWANPRDTVMDGALKQTVKAQGMDIAIELTSFKRAQ